MQHTNTSSTSGGSTTGLFYNYFIDVQRLRRAMAHETRRDEEQDGHSAVKQNPADSLKNTHLREVAPHLEFVV